MTAKTERKMWTVAYRNPRANRFLRVALNLTWRQAYDLAGKLSEAEPGLQVYYVLSADGERAEAARLAADVKSGRKTQAFVDSYLEDHGKILVDSGRRVRILEGGKLPTGLVVESTVAALDVLAAEATEPIHHVTRYGNVISCGVTGPVRVEETAAKVTCEACKAADRQHLIDSAHGQALRDDAAMTEPVRSYDVGPGPYLGRHRIDPARTRAHGLALALNRRLDREHPRVRRPPVDARRVVVKTQTIVVGPRELPTPLSAHAAG